MESEDFSSFIYSILIKAMSIAIPKMPVRFPRSLREIKSSWVRQWLARRILDKWNKDKLHLPLTPKHYELYETIHLAYWHKLKDFPNLIDCRDLNDKIQWLKLFDQKAEIVQCADKVSARDFVRDCVGEGYLLQMYQVKNEFSEIDLESLPKSFVIKANHDSGSVILVRDKSDFEYDSAKEFIDSALAKNYGWNGGEWAYRYIQPRVLVEEYIDPGSTSPPADYKFFCVDGTVRFVHYIYDRGADVKSQILDPKGGDMGLKLNHQHSLGTSFKRPKAWDEMIAVSESLSKEFKFVRVDLFCAGEQIYVGELTFWSMSGHYQGEDQRILGQLIDFDRTTFNPFLLPALDEMQNFSEPSLC